MLEDSRNNNKELKEKVEDSFRKANLVAMNETGLHFEASNLNILYRKLTTKGTGHN